MKKLVLLFLILILFGLCACGGQGMNTTNPDNTTISTGEPPVDDKTPVQSFNGKEQQPTTGETGSASVYIKLYDPEKSPETTLNTAHLDPSTKYQISEIFKERIKRVDFLFWKVANNTHYRFSVYIKNGVLKARFENLQTGDYKVRADAYEYQDRLLFSSDDNLVTITKNSETKMKITLKVSTVQMIRIILKNIPGNFQENAEYDTYHFWSQTFHTDDNVLDFRSSTTYRDKQFIFDSLMALNSDTLEIRVCDKFDDKKNTYCSRFSWSISLWNVLEDYTLELSCDGGNGNVDVDIDFEQIDEKITVVLSPDTPTGPFTLGTANVVIGKIKINNSTPGEVVMQSLDVNASNLIAQNLRLYKTSTQVSPVLAIVPTQEFFTLEINHAVITPPASSVELSLVADIPFAAVQEAQVIIRDIKFININNREIFTMPAPIRFDIVTQ